MLFLFQRSSGCQLRGLSAFIGLSILRWRQAWNAALDLTRAHLHHRLQPLCQHPARQVQLLLPRIAQLVMRRAQRRKVDPLTLAPLIHPEQQPPVEQTKLLELGVAIAGAVASSIFVLIPLPPAFPIHSMPSEFSLL